MAQCPPSSKYIPGAMSLVYDQIKTVVEGVYCVFGYHQHDKQKLIINGRISKTSLTLF